MEIRQDGVGVVAIGSQQAVLFSLCDGDDGAMAGRELALCLGVLHHLEILQVGTLAELVVPIGIAVIHHYPGLAVDSAAHAYTLHSLLRLVHMRIQLGPLAAIRLSGLSRQLPGHGLEDAPSALALVKEMVLLVGRIEHDVTIDGGRTVVEEESGCTQEVGEVVVYIRIINAVE